MTDRRNNCDLGINCLCDRDGEPYCTHQNRQPERISFALALTIFAISCGLVVVPLAVVAFRYFGGLRP